MIQISLIFIGIYAFYLILKIGIQFTITPYIFILPIATIVIMTIAIIRLLKSINRNETKRANLFAMAILLIPLIGFFIERNQINKLTEQEFLSAYSDGVISRADIVFYQNGTMKYCSISLIGEQCYLGNFKIFKDTIMVAYSNKSPKLASRKLINNGRKLLFVNLDNNIEHEFYLNKKDEEDLY